MSRRIMITKKKRKIAEQPKKDFFIQPEFISKILSSAVSYF